MHRLLLISSLLVSVSSSAQYCLTAGPSSTADSNIESVSLTGDVGSISYTGCPGVLGVEEVLGQSTILGAGNSYNLYIQFGTCGGNYFGAGEAWIDFNQNSIFELSESLGTWSGSPPTALSTFSFTVPPNAVMGSTRMRIIQAENATLPMDPCAAFLWGSATDFSVSIQGGMDCSGYQGNDETDPRPVTTIPFSEAHSTSTCYTNENTVYASPDVYYLIAPLPAVSSLQISLCGSSFDTFLTVTDSDGTAIAINDDYTNCGSQSQITVPTAGHDSLFVIVEGWGIQSGAYTINITAGTLDVQQLDLTSAHAIYPNPSNSTIKITGDFQGDYRILNNKGQVILADTIIGEEEINIAHLPNGLYFVELVSEHTTTTQKLLVE